MRNSDIELRHLRLILAIAEKGSLTTVARHLGITQPALSRQLRDLELRLRTPLFERTARRMVLTPAGEQLTHVARHVLAEVDAFQQQVKDGAFVVTRGRVRLATECYTAYHWLPQVLREFQSRWPSVELEIASEHTSAPIAALQQGALDLAVVYRRSAEKRIRFEPLFDDEMVVITSPDHPFAAQEYVPVEAIENEHLLAYTSLTNARSAVRDILEAADVQPRKTTQLQLTEAILELVAANFGVAILARWAAAASVREGKVHATRLGENGCTRTWYAAVRTLDVTPAYQFDLLEMLRRHLGPRSFVRAAHDSKTSKLRRQ